MAKEITLRYIIALAEEAEVDCGYAVLQMVIEDLKQLEEQIEEMRTKAEGNLHSSDVLLSGRYAATLKTCEEILGEE